MANRRTFHLHPGLDVLEPRIALSGLTPANVIGTSPGNVARPHAGQHHERRLSSRGTSRRGNTA